MNQKQPFKIAFFSAKPYDITAFKPAFEAHFEVIFFTERLTESSAILAENCNAVCCFVNDDLSQPVLQRLSEQGVKFVALRCAGFNNVDLDAAKAHSIQIARVPAYSPEAVAEHCMALILTLARKTHKAYNRVKENNFDLNGLLGFNLHGKTIGVIGMGKIGKAFSNIVAGFGAHLVYHDPYVSHDKGKAVSLDELYCSSDIIALHCPLTEQTHHLINSEALAKMKPGVMIVNTSRGALLDTKACIQALKAKHIGQLALDVYEQESELFFKDMSLDILDDDVFSRLLTFPNVLITGHQGFFTQEAVAQIVTTTLGNVTQFATNQSVTNLVQ